MYTPRHLNREMNEYLCSHQHYCAHHQALEREITYSNCKYIHFETHQCQFCISTQSISLFNIIITRHHHHNLFPITSGCIIQLFQYTNQQLANLPHDITHSLRQLYWRQYSGRCTVSHINGNILHKIR